MTICSESLKDIPKTTAMKIRKKRSVIRSPLLDHLPRALRRHAKTKARSPSPHAVVTTSNTSSIQPGPREIRSNNAESSASSNKGKQKVLEPPRRAKSPTGPPPDPDKPIKGAEAQSTAAVTPLPSPPPADTFLLQPGPSSVPTPQPVAPAHFDENTIAVAVNDSLGDTDSAFASSSEEDDTTSISSSILAYRYENGRRYHAYREGRWVMPNDEAEQDRMDLLHHIFLLRLNGELFCAPITDTPQRILDIGTGTGIWAIDMADRYPSAQIIGTDLSPIQPTWVPSNCRFEVDDCEQQEWTFARDSFDLIHIRNLSGGIKDWPGLFERCYKHVKPGGYLEVQDVPSIFLTDDDSLPQDCTFNKMVNLFYSACGKAGLDFTTMEKMKGWMEGAGFEVEQKILRLPIGVWPQDKVLKELGKYMLANMVESLEAYCLALFARYLNMEHDEIKRLLTMAARDLKRNDIHMYFPVYFIYGRKPFSTP